jgi:DNA-binding LacI/PurR family transcriptional regulator
MQDRHSVDDDTTGHAGTRRRGRIGIVIRADDLTVDTFATVLLDGVTAESAEQLLQLSIWIADPQQGIVARPTIPAAEIDGMIVHSSAASDPWLDELAAARVPIVSVGRWTGAPGSVQMVDADHESGAVQVLSHLVGLGRRRIAVITGPLHMFDVIARLDAFVRMRADHDLDPDPTLVVRGDFTVASGHAAMCELLRRTPDGRPDAVFAMNDHMAAGAIRAIVDAGLRVPEDVAVAGFDHTLQSMLLPMSLTTVHQDVRSLGARAVRALVDLMAGARPGDPELVPVRLVVGASTDVSAGAPARTFGPG